MASKHITVHDFATLPGNVIDGSWYFPELAIPGKKRSTWQVVVSATLDQQPVSIVPFLDNKPTTAVGVITVISRIIRMDNTSSVRDAKPTYVRAGKNIGKKSETNAICQAMRNALSMHHKKEKSTNGFRPPMLAQIYSNQREHTFPVDVQIKYNGLRCVASLHNDVVTYESRTGAPYDLPYLDADVKLLLKCTNGRLDGELYKHGMSLQDINHAARSSTESDKLNYIVYDVSDTAHPGITYNVRKQMLLRCDEKFSYVQLAPTFVAENNEQLSAYYEKFLADGYEGAMVRLDKPYEYGVNNYHSKYLLKMKPVNDGEYELIGWSFAEKGKADGALMLECKTKLGETFTVTPAMEVEERMALARTMNEVERNGKTHFENHYAGRMMVIYYDELSNTDKPLRARTKMEFRDVRF